MLTVLSMVCTLSPQTALAAEAATSTMAVVLDRFAHARHIELLFDERLLSGKQPSVPTPAASVEQALAQILKGTGLTYRKLPSGVYVILAGRALTNSFQTSHTPTETPPSPPIPDILVTGHRTLDTDLLRSNDDTQPYRTTSHDAIQATQPGTVDEFLKTQLPQNSQTLSLNQAPFNAGGAVRSQIDLRGLGPSQTLVLVNGRRLPSVPGLGELLQPDVSALPIHSIDRIETLASSAGGIFGIGAAGGAVNIVTNNEFHDVTLVLGSGVTQRADGAQRLIDGHVGWTSKGGQTQISLRYTHRGDDGLSFGDRSAVQDSRLLRYQRVGAQNYLPTSASVNIASVSGADLTLIPALGGQSLGSSTSYLPVATTSLASGGVAALLGNAGHVDLTMAPDGQGTRQSLLTPTQSNAVMATLRQGIGDSLVLYADYLRLGSIGNAVIAGTQTATSLAVGAQGNPFAQPILVTYPASSTLGSVRSRTLTDRVTLGAIWHMSARWVANLDAATGQAVVDQSESYTPISLYAINPFSGAASFAQQLSQISATPFYRSHATNRLRDINLRVAGPLASLPAGPLFITMTGEFRDENAPGATYDNYVSSPTLHSTTSYQSARQRVGSAFAEARFPLFAKAGAAAPWRGLEAQLAVRADRYEIAAPITNPQLLQLGTFGNEAKARGTVVALTASLRAEPISGITLRASYADAYTPPTQSQITPNGYSFGFFPYSDPKRPRDSIFSSVQTLFLYGGLPSQQPAHARTWSVGTIIKPAIIQGLRLSLDASILKTDHEITDVSLAQFQYFVTNEALYPGRIQRAPLTAADVAAGYTAGRITQVDATYLSTGSSILTALDLALDFDRATGLGRLHLFGQASWEPRLRRGAIGAGSYELVNAMNGPLSLRASGGAELSRGPWSLGLNAQVYGAYHVTYAAQPGSLEAASYVLANATNLQEQGTSRIPAQAYLDAWIMMIGAGSSSRSARPSLSYRFGIKNLLDKMPPIVVPPLSGSFDGIGYSPLGDPRGRRFEFEITARL